MSQTHPFKIFSGEKSEYIAKQICRSLDCELGKKTKTTFSDGEFVVCYDETVRGCIVFIVQSTFPNSDNLMELLLMIDAAKRASAYKIVAVMPYYGWARQDRKDKPRVSIAAKLSADLLAAAGVDRIITMDLHADQIQGFFDIPVDHLYASTVFIPYLKNLKLADLVIASPDVGGSKRANSYAQHLGVPLVLCHKTRLKANEVASMSIIGEVKDKNVVIIDDMADTAGTLAKAANLMVENGAKSVRAMVTHAIMSGNAVKNITESQLTELICTDSIPFDTTRCPKVKILSVAEMFGNTISSVFYNKSISEQYLF
ncbi:ribose-phosphate pyrophosphokinase [Porphyromonadaceae bacterium COT-184 OH4590]|nr:ribose-phosphate pyrophosphokinase [Porphyromonadaceae bacterium COT-184 OH4590]MDO4726504.1 ribose-phosphate pyrophosphokinase [Porphyromonadaceae bacterium]